MKPAELEGLSALLEQLDPVGAEARACVFPLHDPVSELHVGVDDCHVVPTEQWESALAMAIAREGDQSSCCWR